MKRLSRNVKSKRKVYAMSAAEWLLLPRHMGRLLYGLPGKELDRTVGTNF